MSNKNVQAEIEKSQVAFWFVEILHDTIHTHALLVHGTGYFIAVFRMPMQMFVRSFVHYTRPSLKECPLRNPSGAPTQRSNLDGQDKTFCHPPPRHGWSIPRFAWMCTELKSGFAKRNLCHKIDRGCGRPRPQRRSKF